MVIRPLNRPNDILRDRAKMFAYARDFFAGRNILEVDVPALSPTACIDAHIDLIEVKVCGKAGYLHSSPEYFMKRLLARQIGDIYQLSHVFRDGEISHKHNPEFTMAEWYRMDFSLDAMIDETIAFCALFLEDCPHTVQKYSYRALFEKYVGFYPDAQLERDRLLAFEIEPQFAGSAFTVIYDFPESEAALAQVVDHTAKRFEIFYGATELANGYLELQDAGEYRRRFQEANQRRQQSGKQAYPMDELFLQELEKTPFEPCCGVAVGFDRLMMLRHDASHIGQVLPFHWLC